MAVVSFEQIQKVLTSQTPVGLNGATSYPYGPMDGQANRPTLYDPIWGYFLFGQTHGFEYNETETYLDITTFTIQGIYTLNAEAITGGGWSGFSSDIWREFTAEDWLLFDIGVMIGLGSSTGSEAEAFHVLSQKYNALNTYLDNARVAKAPDLYADWGTSLDPRCIPLPSPLFDKNGHVVYALPESLEIEQTRWPMEIKYKCTLREAKFPQSKLIVNDVILDHGQIDITPPRPIFAQHRPIGTSGAILQVQNYTALEMQASGILPLPTPNGKALTDDISKVMRELSKGNVTVKVAHKDGTVDTVFEDMAIDGPPSVAMDYLERAAQVAVKGKGY